MSRTAVLTGYATLDFVVSCAEEPIGPGAYFADIRSDSAWPRAGGAPLYAGGALALAGAKATPLVQVGDDRNGLAYRAACDTAGVSVQGIEIVSRGRSPCCILVHHAVGSVTCYLDPGTVDAATLSAGQTAALQAADLVIICVGPETVTDAVLNRLRPHQELAWIAKADARCFPLSLRTRILSRAATVFCNQTERDFIEEARITSPAEQLLIETRGGDGVVVQQGGSIRSFPVEPIDVVDATGAGDTFAGAFLAARLTGATPKSAAQSAIAQTGKFLRTRTI